MKNFSLSDNKKYRTHKENYTLLGVKPEPLKWCFYTNKKTNKSGDLI